MDNKQETRSSMVFDELTSTCKRIQLVVNNCSNPVEVFIGQQVYNALDNIIADLRGLLANPNLDATAEQFVKMMHDRQ